MNNSSNSLVEGLERLGLIASRIRQNQGSVPQIEIDIILQELRNLYMTCLQLEKDETVVDMTDTLELDIAAAAKKAAEEKRLAEEAAAKKAAEEKRLAEEIAAKKAAEEKRLAEEAAAKKAAEAAATAAAIAAANLSPKFAPETSPAKPEVPVEAQMEKLSGNPNDILFADEPAPAKTEKPREASLFDFLSNDRNPEKPTVRTIGDTLNQKVPNVEQRLESRVNAKKVSDLREIIGINDKFSFMSDLFHNKMKDYNDFILHLNALNDREEALAYVATVAEEYKWREDSAAVVNFYRVFDRKF